MKRLLFFFLLLVGVQAWGQVDTLNPLTSKQIADSVFSSLDTYVQTGKLYNRLLLEDTSLSISWNIDQIGKDSIYNHSNGDYMYGLLYEMKSMSIDTSSVTSLINVYDSVYSLMGEIDFETEKLIYPIAIMDYSYNYLDVNKNLSENKIIQSDGVIDVLNIPLIEEKKARLIGPLFDYFESDEMGIVFKKEYFFSNDKQANNIVQIQVTHKNQVFSLDWNSIYEFSPENDSIQLFKVKILYDDGSLIENYFVINTPDIIKKNSLKNNSFPDCTTFKIDDKEFIEQDGNRLEWCLIPRCGYDGRISKPYILLTGYRPPIFGQSFKKTWKFYNDEHQSLLNSLRNNNYDVLLVKFNMHAMECVK